ncbi:acetyl-CoA hydrolase/transferase family protein [Frankia sp. AgKG'84/4]|uniref:acetyl-CoA hydrolase/transferase family protein n=1 Tax=Frankia sp. AgKG'84/4 TaxID=573490 RepID=UPI00200ED52C|nr:acetyl-CoA hydrolase/transferase C-terminal domain-containing protein [Frankia sp. AgKG'84/4]MCL9793461.1 4-hydroxybutyrate CoA-transferase [Frankia sp. AgKG'84/4]
MRIVSESRLGELVVAHLGGRAVDAAGTPPVVVASGNFASPAVALLAVDRCVASYRLFVLNPQRGLPVRPGVSHVTPFVGPGMRELATLEYVPCRLSLVPRLFAGPYRPDVVVLHTSLPADGRVSLGTEVNILPAAVEAARAGGGLVVAQLNPDMPYTFGDGELPVDLVDLAVEAQQPLPSPAARVLGEAARAIGERVAALVADGATLQMGIGGVPDATLAALTARRGLRVWTETFSDGVLDLDRAGAFDTGADLVTSFLFGSEDLYRWVDRNPRVRLLRTETVNDPGRIARQPAMTSINTALQVDLHAQANASYVRGRIWSGFGGQPDFVAGALHAPGGHAIIALPSWHARTDTSTVVPALTEPTTSFQHSYIVSEHGTAALWGRSLREQARALVAHVADPRARVELTQHVEQAAVAPPPRPRSVR